MIDAKEVSAAHRARYFWGNLPGMNRLVCEWWENQPSICHIEWKNIDKKLFKTLRILYFVFVFFDHIPNVYNFVLFIFFKFDCLGLSAKLFYGKIRIVLYHREWSYTTQTRGKNVHCIFGWTRSVRQSLYLFLYKPLIGNVPSYGSSMLVWSTAPHYINGCPTVSSVTSDCIYMHSNTLILTGIRLYSR